jgi:hypothetical protein
MGDSTDMTARISTPTFIPPEALSMHYTLLASPTLYPGQRLRASLSTDENNREASTVQLFLRHYDASDQLVACHGPSARLMAGESHDFEWTIPDLGGQPIGQVGLEVRSSDGAGDTIYLDYMTWDGVPEVDFARPEGRGSMWRRAWINGVDQFEGRWPEPYRIVQNHGTGLLIQGTQEWTDYRVDAPVTVHLAKASGIAARVGGLRRYYALLLCDDGKARLVKALDGNTVLAETAFPWEVRRSYTLSLVVVGNRIEARIDGKTVFDITDQDRPLTGGALALICEEGCLSSGTVSLRPAQ